MLCTRAERRLVESVQSCHNEDYAKLWELFKEYVRLWIEKQVGTTGDRQYVIDECLQLVCFKAWEKLKQKQPQNPDVFPTYLFKITYSRVGDWFRAEKTDILSEAEKLNDHTQDEILSADEPEPPSHSLIAQGKFLREKFDAEQLTPQVRSIFVEVFLDQKKPGEVAKKLGIEVKKVYNEVFLFRERAKEYLIEYKKGLVKRSVATS